MSNEPNMAELFSRDPAQHSNADFEAIIAELRASRHKFHADPTARTSSKTMTPKQKEVSGIDIDIKI